jgi:hypothetical protein
VTAEEQRVSTAEQLPDFRAWSGRTACAAENVNATIVA